MIGKKAYDALPPDLQKVVQEVKGDFAKWQSNHWEKRRTETINFFKKEEITITEFPAAEAAEMKAMYVDMWKAAIAKSEAQGNAAGEAFNSLQNIIKKYIPDYEIPYVYKK